VVIYGTSLSAGGAWAGAVKGWFDTNWRATGDWNNGRAIDVDVGEWGNGVPGTWNSSESGHPDIFVDDDGQTTCSIKVAMAVVTRGSCRG